MSNLIQNFFLSFSIESIEYGTFVRFASGMDVVILLGCFSLRILNGINAIKHLNMLACKNTLEVNQQKSVLKINNLLHFN